MCGLAGYLLPRSMTLSDPDGVITRMATALAHRGPDDSDIWRDGNIALGHRRLSIVDLSAAGHQPMHSATDRYVIAYNGEIYNCDELRAALESVVSINWRGHSDTEILLAGVEAWGLKGILERAVGMFALALWDKKTRRLSLTRDRMGEKPLYYGRSGGALLFASELKAFRAFPGFNPEIDPEALALYLSFCYIPAPRSIFKDIHKLQPGTILHVTEDGREESEAYWSLNNAFRAPRFAGTAEDAVDELDLRLRRAVRQQSIADVPLGAFLSGGIDSSTVVSLMQAQASMPVRTFSIGFEEAEFNEAHYASAVARHLGTEHTELTVTAKDALDVVPRLPEIWDEPFADSSQIPTFIVARLARQAVTVSLSGDAGDELFCGYDWYFSSNALEKLPGRAVFRAALNHIPHQWIESVARAAPARMGRNVTARRLESVAHALNMDSPHDRYIARMSQWQDAPALVSGAPSGLPTPTDYLPPADTEFLNYMSAIDAKSYLPDDILVKVDRAAMAVSLETRVPLLDHRIVEFSFSLPGSYKVRDGQSKWPLRRLLYRHVPRAMVERPKSGFNVPVAEWLRGPLRDWADALLTKDAVGRGGLMNPEPIVRLWHQHRAGSHNWDSRLWSVLMFQSWRARYGC